MEDRDKILAAVRIALEDNPLEPDATELFPRDAYASNGADELLRQLEKCSCEVHELKQLEDLPAAAAEVLQAHQLPLRLALAPAKLGELPWDQHGVAWQETWDEQLVVALTAVDGAIAETGQLVVNDRSDPQHLSLLADTHLALLKRDAIHPSLDHLAAALGPEPAGAAALIAGPSRTADIEQTLILGAHGPRRVVVFVY